MKLKYVEHKRTEIETDIELPVYLYFQDEDCLDEYVKFDGKEAVIVKQGFLEYKVVRDYNYQFYEHYMKCFTEKEYFDEALNEAIEIMQQ